MLDSLRASNEKLLELFRLMLMVRCFEEEATRQYDQVKIPGVLHVSLGQEAVAAGVCGALNDSDYIISNHRGHGHSIAKGTPPRMVMAELLAKVTGCCKGIGGSMHSTHTEKGVLFCTAIVGAGVPIAVGVGLALKMDKKPNVVACFFGDGAVNTGAFHEGVNLAALWRVPVIFVCENNLYAISTKIDRSTLVVKLADKALSYGMPSVSIDGNDLEEVYSTTAQAVDRARSGGGPTLIECKTYRWTGHNYKKDLGEYMPKEEVEAWRARDPVKIMRERLKERGVLDDLGFEKTYIEVRSIIEEAVKYADESPYPTTDTMMRYVYVEDEKNEKHNISRCLK